jgi:SAM-dependent methyltransferase
MEAQVAEYDRIGSLYSEAKQEPFRIHLEAYTLENLAGDVAGARVLDLACGDGFYSRRLARLGAAETVGVDTSAEMVALGRRAEASERLGCRYIHADVNDLDGAGDFDLVIAAFLLNYARTLDELRRLCTVGYTNLRPGGRLVGVNDYTNDGCTGTRDFTRHAFRKTGPDPYQEGAPISYVLLLSEGRSFTITNYFWRPETYADALRAAGFRDVAWHMLELSRQGEDKFTPGFFADLLERHPLAAFAAHK